jgi:NADPH:quinone reductase-like Zn-dependent oxidoreductase
MPEFDPNAWPEPSLVTRILSWFLNPHGNPHPARLRRAVEGKIVLITGASFGIGEATARCFAAAGATVLLVARSKGELEQLTGDVPKPAAVDPAVNGQATPATAENV